MRVFGLAALLLLACSPPAPPLPPAYELPYGPSPFSPAEARVVGADVLQPDALLGSTACGRCHPQIAAQWQSSLHRAGAADRFYRFSVDRMAEDYGVAATRLCVACHEPGLLLSGGVDRGAPANPASRREGVSCLSCHLVTSTHATSQLPVIANGSYAIEPLDAALVFPPPDGDAEAVKLHGRALRRPFLSENRFCDACHRFFIPTELGGSPPGRLRLQSAEAAGTRYGDPAAPGYRSCVDCHMPLMAGADPAARNGRIHDHRVLGANLWVPAAAGDREHEAATLAFRRAGAVTLEVGDPERDAGGSLRVPVTVRNDANGHDFPTGATDVSETWIELTLVDARGVTVFESPGLDRDGFLSPRAPTLVSLVVLAGGQVDFLHDLLSQVDLRRHPRVRPGGTQTLPVEIALPDDARPPLRAHVTLRARHGNQRWNRWAFNWAPVQLPVADLAEVTRELGDPPPAPALAAAPAPRPEPSAPEGMVYVPAGRYPIGADPAEDPDAMPEEQPRHLVEVAAFFLDRVPVTNAAWAEAVRAGEVPAPPAMTEPSLAAHAWTGDHPPAGLEQHPVALVRHGEAAAYCRARGKRLPREEEWEAAARGTEGRRYAWGGTFDAARCNTSESLRGRSEPVGAHPENAGPFGALDLGCNVSEWVQGAFLAYPASVHGDNRGDWLDHFVEGLVVTRGASYEQSHRAARASARGFDQQRVRKLIGFRCAQDAPGGKP